MLTSELYESTMTIEDIHAICKRLNGVTEDIKWEDRLCFNVGGKMFLITVPDAVPVSASFKVADDTFEELSEREGFMPAPYLARYKWIFVDDIRRLSRKQWIQYIDSAYKLVASRLPARKRKELGF